jgi:multidrug efflux pump subunit AcrA (membrane-fusion protein)
MSTATTQSKLGQTRRESAESKAETTKRISQELLQAEAEQRRAKTDKLRAARLARQAGQTVLGAAKPQTSKTRKRIGAKA